MQPQSSLWICQGGTRNISVQMLSRAVFFQPSLSILDQIFSEKLGTYLCFYDFANKRGRSYESPVQILQSSQTFKKKFQNKKKHLSLSLTWQHSQQMAQQIKVGRTLTVNPTKRKEIMRIQEAFLPYKGIESW